MKTSFLLPAAAGILCAAATALAAPGAESVMPGSQGGSYEQSAPTAPDAVSPDPKPGPDAAGSADKKDTVSKADKKKKHKHGYDESKEPAASGS